MGGVLCRYVVTKPLFEAISGSRVPFPLNDYFNQLSKKLDNLFDGCQKNSYPRFRHETS